MKPYHQLPELPEEIQERQGTTILFEKIVLLTRYQKLVQR